MAALFSVDHTKLGVGPKLGDPSTNCQSWAGGDRLRLACPAGRIVVPLLRWP